MQLKEIKNNITFTIRRYKGYFGLTTKNGIPRLHVHERFENSIKWVLRIITIIGIVTSVISFQIWYLNLTVALLLVGLEQFLEKVVFIYTTILVTPIPTSYKSEDWYGMAWGYSLQNTEVPYLVGPIFSNKESAERIFSCIKSWNYNKDEDFNNNIAISVILEDTDDYSLYMYPGMNRISEKQWDETAKKMRPEREHQGLVYQVVFCKPFKYSGSHLVQFIKKYKTGQKYRFGAFINDSGKAIPVKELGFIIKNHIKIKQRSELTSKDLELDHGKMVMNL